MGRLVVLGLCAIGLVITGAIVWPRPPSIEAEPMTCRTHVPALPDGGRIDLSDFPARVQNWDPCTQQVTLLDDALEPEGGPFLSRDLAEERAIGAAKPTRVRAYLLTHREAMQMLQRVGLRIGESVQVYPERMQWLVFVEAQGGGSVPSLKYSGGTHQYRPARWLFRVFDAKTSVLLLEGEGSGEFPDALPETEEDRERDRARQARQTVVAAYTPTPRPDFAHKPTPPPPQTPRPKVPLLPFATPQPTVPAKADLPWYPPGRPTPPSAGPPPKPKS